MERLGRKGKRDLSGLCAVTDLLRAVIAVAALGPIALPPQPAAEVAARSQSDRSLSEQRTEVVELQEAVRRLLDDVGPGNKANWFYPAFARQRIAWLRDQIQAGRLTLRLTSETPEGDENAVMASGIVDGAPTLLIPLKRFRQLLAADGRVRPPFTQRQKNDFALALVHEVVHLQGGFVRGSRSSRNAAERLREELRTWWEVNLYMVRPLRQFHQPMNATFLAIDDAFRTCGDVQHCPLVKSLISPKRLKRDGPNVPRS